MTRREAFLAVVDGRVDGPVCSPQIGGGAGFDTRLAGKEWVSETTLDDTLSAVERFDILPLVLIDPGDLLADVDSLAWQETLRVEKPDRREIHSLLSTPVGELHRHAVEQPHEAPFQTHYPVQDLDDLRVLEYCLDAMIEAPGEAFTRNVRNAVAQIASRAAACVQWAAQPYEMLCWPDTARTVYLAMDAPQQFRRLMEKIVRLDAKLIAAAAEAGADFLFLGGPGAEMVSPEYYRQFILPGSGEVSSMAHQAGLRVYSHICSPVEPMLTMGFYNEMGIDLFETLSPPPVGNVTDLGEACRQLDERICTRGNLGLDVLLHGRPEDVRDAARRIVEATRGRKHIVAASDYLFYDTPETNVQAMIDAVDEYGRSTQQKR